MEGCSQKPVIVEVPGTGVVRPDDVAHVAETMNRNIAQAGKRGDMGAEQPLPDAAGAMVVTFLNDAKDVPGLLKIGIHGTTQLPGVRSESREGSRHGHEFGMLIKPRPQIKVARQAQRRI